MQIGNTLFTKITAVAAVSGLLALGAVSPSAFAKGRGNSGLPPGPGNPIANLQEQVNGLQGQIDDLDERVDDLENAASQTALMWINHLLLSPGDANVATSVSNIGGLIALLISTPAAVAGTVETVVQVPPGYSITGVRVCYSVPTGGSIGAVTLSQVQDPPTGATEVFNDSTGLTSEAPICEDSAATSVDPSLGAVILRLAVAFANMGDEISLRALGLYLAPTPAP